MIEGAMVTQIDEIIEEYEKIADTKKAVTENVTENVTKTVTENVTKQLTTNNIKRLLGMKKSHEEIKELLGVTDQEIAVAEEEK